MRTRTSGSVWLKKAKWTPNVSSSHDEGPASASSSWKRSLPSAVSLYTTLPRRPVSGGAPATTAASPSVAEIHPSSRMRRRVG